MPGPEDKSVLITQKSLILMDFGIVFIEKVPRKCLFKNGYVRKYFSKSELCILINKPPINVFVIRFSYLSWSVNMIINFLLKYKIT